MQIDRCLSEKKQVVEIKRQYDEEAVNKLLT